MHRVIAVHPLAGYRLEVIFSDGLAGVVDLSHLAGHGVFEAWLRPGEFEKAFVDPESDTVAWPGGIDLCPNRLHSDVADAVG